MKFRWGYIGNGNIAKSTARSITNGEHIITAVYGRNKQKAMDFAQSQNAKCYDSVDELLKDNNIDAIYIATPHTSHLEYTLMSLNALKPVLCEKPVGVTEKQARLMIDTAKQKNVYFCEAMWTWFSDVALTVKKWVNIGMVGEIKSVEIDYSFPGLMKSKTSRVRTPSTAGGALLDVGIYPITYCYNLFGYPCGIKCNGVIKDGIDIKETIVLSYDNFDCTLNVSLTTLKEGLKIVASKGTITVPIFHMGTRAILKNQNGKNVFKGETSYLTEFDKVANEIKDGKTQSDYIPFNATLDCLKIMDECRKQMNLVYPFETV